MKPRALPTHACTHAESVNTPFLIAFQRCLCLQTTSVMAINATATRPPPSYCTLPPPPSSDSPSCIPANSSCFQLLLFPRAIPIHPCHSFLTVCLFLSTTPCATTANTDPHACRPPPQKNSAFSRFRISLFAHPRRTLAISRLDIILSICLPMARRPGKLHPPSHSPRAKHNPSGQPHCMARYRRTRAVPLRGWRGEGGRGAAPRCKFCTNRSRALFRNPAIPTHQAAAAAQPQRAAPPDI